MSATDDNADGLNIHIHFLNECDRFDKIINVSKIHQEILDITRHDFYKLINYSR